MHTWWSTILVFEFPVSDFNENLVSNCWPKQKVKQIDHLLASRHLKLNVSFVPVMNMISIPNCLFPQVLSLTIEIFLSQLLRRLGHAVCIFIWLHTNIPVTPMFMWHNNLQTSAPQQVTHSVFIRSYGMKLTRIQNKLSSESGFYTEPNTLVCRINLLNKRKAHRVYLWTSHCMPWRSN